MRLKKRTLVLLGVVVVAIAAAFGAYAYFTSGGSGSGTAAVGTSTNFSISSTASGGPLQPGGATQTVHFSVTNNNATGSQYIDTITLTGVKACPSGSNYYSPFNDNPGSGCSTDGSFANATTEVATCESYSGALVNPGGQSNGSGVDFWLHPTVEQQDIAGGATVSVGLNAPTQTLVMNDNGNQDSCKSVNLTLLYTSN